MITQPNPKLKASASLWSADLARLAEEIERVDRFVDLYHIDVSDGTYANQLLFFPDLVAAVRHCTVRPLEVHLITHRPERWLESFAQTGANRIIFYPDTTENPERLIDQIHNKGLQAGMSLAIEHSPVFVERWLSKLDCVVVLGTAIDTKGVIELAPGTCEKVKRLVEYRTTRDLQFEIEADGAIRRNTVPRLRQAGADIVVPGSLMFQGDPEETSHWLWSL